MPHTASAWKRLRKNEKRKKQNRVVAKIIRVKRKAVVAALKEGDAAKIDEAAKAAQSTLDRSADKGYIHRNKAARLKSRFAKKLKATAEKK
jgi:small subunit ribosomal protein S20